MAFFDFRPGDIIHTAIVANPQATITLAGHNVTGSVYLEYPYQVSALSNRQIRGFSERLGGLTTQFATITASINIQPAVKFGTNYALYGAIQNLFQFYSIYDTKRYSFNPQSSSFSVINIPEVYYDRCIQSGTFSGSDFDSSGSIRTIYDDGHGGIYRGSNTGSLVGSIFYSEGLVVLTDSTLSDFGLVSTGSVKWSFSFCGQHTIPVNLYRCRAPAGQLNASTNTSFYTVPGSGMYKNTRQALTSSLTPYITAVGLYNDDFELVAVGRLAQPVRKEFGWDVGINLKLDW
jgi:hypothetical protein